MDLRIYFLRALNFAERKKDCPSQKSFNDQLRKAHPPYSGNASTLSKLRHGDDVGPATQLQLTKALDALCAEWKISSGQLPELKNEGPDLKQQKLRLEPVPSSLIGMWLFIQHRSVRKDANSRFPESGYRTAVLTYGRNNKKRRDISIVGESTGWAGHVQMLDKKLYHFADEFFRTGIVNERAFFITFPPFDREEPPAQNGVVLGISRGKYEFHSPPVYASRLVLRRLPSTICPTEAPPEFLRKQFCGYFNFKMRRRKGMNKASWDFLLESFKKFEKVSKSPHSIGKRIFVNPN